MGRVGEEMLRCAFLDNRSLIHEENAVGDLAGKTHLMGHHDHRHPGIAGQPPHHVQDFLDHLRIQGRGGLVEQHDLGLHRQGPRDGHALLLASGELRRVDVRLLGDADAIQQLDRHAFRFVLRPFPDFHRRQADILQGGEVREQVERLEHHPDFAAHRINVVHVVGELDPVHDDAAALVTLQPVDASDHRGLPRSRWPGDDHHLPRPDLYGDPAQDVQLAEPLMDILQQNDWAVVASARCRVGARTHGCLVHALTSLQVYFAGSRPGIATTRYLSPSPNRRSSVRLACDML